MKKTLMFLVGFCALAAAGFYGTTWYGTYHALQRIKSQMASVGVLDWQSITPSISGQVKVDDLRLTLFELSQPIHVNSVVFAAGSSRALLQWSLGREVKRPQLTINDMKLILRPELTKSWVPAAEDRLRWPRPWRVRACGEQRTLGGADLIAMGLDIVDIDLTLSSEQVDDGAVSLRGEVNADALGSFDFTMTTRAFPASMEGLTELLPWQWQSLEVFIRDGGFMRRLAAFCAQDRHESPEAWARLATDELQGELAGWGILPSKPLTALYRQWLENGGELSMVLPSTPAGGFSNIQSVAKYLGQDSLAILYNNREVTGLDMSLAVEEFRARTAPAVVRLPAPPQADHPAWRATPLASGGQWQERQVRVTLKSGRSLEGRLSAINERQLQVSRVIEGGEFASSAGFRDIAVFEVWRRQGEVPVIPESSVADTAAEQGELPVENDQPIY